MGSAHQLTRSFRRSKPSHRRDEQVVLPSRIAWVLFAVSVVCRSVLSTGVALMLWGILPNLVGLQTTVVMSGSMSPGLQVGDAVVLRPVQTDQLAAGQVLLFDDPDDPGRLRLHRLIAITDHGLETKGDANQDPDSARVDSRSVHGAAFLRIPFGGLPEYWFRTGQITPLMLTGAAALVLYAGVRLERHLEDPSDRRRRRHRGAKLPARRRAVTSALIIGVLAGCTGITPPGAANATLTATASSGSNSWTSPCGDRTPTTFGTSPQLYWGFGSGSGRDVIDLSGQNDTGTAPVGADVVSATCTGGATPFVQVGLNAGKGLVVEKAARPFPGAMTLGMWFKTSVKGGVLADFGLTNSLSPVPATNVIDRALYMRADGNLTFGADTISVAGVLSSPMFCTSSKSGGYADGGWHAVVVTYSPATGCTMNVDTDPLVAQAPPSLGLLLLSGYSGYWRFGYDTVSTTSGWTGATAQQAFQGSIDEVQVYGAVLDSASRAALVARGH